MGSWQKILPSMFAFLVILFILSNCFALGRSAIAPDSSRGKGLRNHSEIHEAKNLIDALSTKLHLNLQTYESKYENFKQQSNEYLKQSGSTKDEIKMLIKLQDILNDLTNSNVKSSICEKFWTDCDFTAARQIIINSRASLQKDFTVTVQVNHRALIDNDSALENGNDLRVYYQREEDCQPREIDRILENIATTKTKVLFKLQEDLPKTGRDGSVYYLVYGNTNAGKAKHNPENVYLFYDDFSDSNLEKKWQKNWGLISIENGALKLNTGKTPTGHSSEISVFVKYGYEWEDIEVEMDFYERNSPKVYPGPYLRVEDARIQTTTAWWFEYSLEGRGCTMRPYKNNQDGSWLYTGTLTKPLSPRTWTHAKYRVVGDRFSHWINNDVIHDNVQVASKWMINKGTFGLGCHNKYSVGCHTSYDNIKITKYVSVLPTVSLGAECKVDLKKFHGVGKSEKNPATSCKQIHDVSLQDGKHRLKNGVYWIKTSADSSAPTYCDLVNGGWTLVGKVSGFVNELYKFWLIKNVNVDALAKAALPSKVSCIDARYLATYHASTVMFSSGDNQKSIGAKWVKWLLPEGRDSDTLWTHSVGYNTVSKAKMNSVTVKAWNGGTKVCYQNKFGIMPNQYHGGSYPSATYNIAGNTATKDYCMAVGVQKKGTTVDGWFHNGDGYDSPQSNSDWPNAQYNHRAPYVTVWVK